MKHRNYDGSVLILIIVCCLFIGFFIGRRTASDIVYLPAVHQAYSEGDLKHNSLCIDLNKASVDDLKLLPGVDKIMAEAIINYRKEYGAFVSVKELYYIEGMTKELYEQIRPHLLIGG